MKKLALLSIIPMIALGASANAACDTSLNEKTWDKTASGYCKIFFPNCNKVALGKRMSYSREVNPEIICVGERGDYRDYYAVTINDANKVFGTEFSKIGVNYTGELSQWLYENCAKYCDDSVSTKIEEVKADTKAEIQEIKADADKKIEAAKKDAEKTKEDVSEKVKEIKADAKAKTEAAKADASDALNEIKADAKAEKEKIKSDADSVKSEIKESETGKLILK